MLAQGCESFTQAYLHYTHITSLLNPINCTKYFWFSIQIQPNDEHRFIWTRYVPYISIYIHSKHGVDHFLPCRKSKNQLKTHILFKDVFMRTHMWVVSGMLKCKKNISAEYQLQLEWGIISTDNAYWKSFSIQHFPPKFTDYKMFYFNLFCAQNYAVWVWVSANSGC